MSIKHDEMDKDITQSTCDVYVEGMYSVHIAPHTIYSLKGKYIYKKKEKKEETKI